MIITVAHSKGGVGKSLLTWHLAIGLKMPIIDLDFQKTLVYANTLRKSNGFDSLEIIEPQSPEEFVTFIENWSEEEDIIIDVGGFDSNLNRTAIYLADMIITPAIDRVTEMAGLYTFHEILKELSSKTQTDIKADILLNDVNPNSKDFNLIEELVDSLEHFNLMESIICHRADFYKSMEEGLGVTEIKKSKKSHQKNRAKEEIKRLIEEIKKRG